MTIFKKLVSLVVIILFTASCTRDFINHPTVVSGSLSDATITVEWYDSIFKFDENDYDEAFYSAFQENLAACQNWGFSSARLLGQARGVCRYKEFNTYYYCEFRQTAQCVSDESRQIPSVSKSRFTVREIVNTTGLAIVVYGFLGLLGGGLIIGLLVS